MGVEGGPLPPAPRPPLTAANCNCNFNCNCKAFSRASSLQDLPINVRGDGSTLGGATGLPNGGTGGDGAGDAGGEAAVHELKKKISRATEQEDFAELGRLSKELQQTRAAHTATTAAAAVGRTAPQASSALSAAAAAAAAAPAAAAGPPPGGAVKCGSHHCAMLLETPPFVRSWGLNSAGQLGDGKANIAVSPQAPLAPKSQDPKWLGLDADSPWTRPGRAVAGGGKAKKDSGGTVTALACGFQFTAVLVQEGSEAEAAAAGSVQEPETETR